MRNKPTVLAIGPVSEGTLRDEDLVEAFLDAADTIRLTRDERKMVNGIRAGWNDPAWVEQHGDSV